MRRRGGWRPGLRQTRLASGLVLFGYVTSHFLNHALGNLSVAAMDRGLAIQKLIWQSAPGAVILYASLVVHGGLGFWALYRRRQFRFTRLEATQLALGLAIPFLLAEHVAGTRVSLSLFGTDKSYVQELIKFAIRSPTSGVLQFLLMLIVWIHGCVGLHFWLSLKPSYPRIKNLLLSLAVVVPTLAMLGAFEGGKEVLRLARDPAWYAAATTPGHVGTPEENAELDRISRGMRALAAALLAAAFLGRAVRRRLERRAGLIELTYPDRAIRIPRGLTVLEASLRYNIPHAHVCGGRGRCSTCRIRVLDGHEALPTASPAEQAVLDRIGADASVRLACQLRPTADVAFAPLLPPHSAVADAQRGLPATSGDERYVVVMFVDLRGSSQLAEGRLPYDTVFIINQFLNAVSRAVIASGGEPNQVLGDGLLALFGLEGGRGREARSTACRQAVKACAAIAAHVEKLNAALAPGLLEPLCFGVGLNAGVTVAGDIGYERHAQFTVIGDAVNVAARLQDLTKSLGCEVLMSEEVYVRAGFSADDLPAHEVDARGRQATVKARSATKAADLARAEGAPVD
ncbi:MAG: adenylate/guanylate cyclase domain-containing protein [Hyphomicrobiales bacterium]|nr:adenylate/guanylate cyclase domain-containing protein [Hyphomicrobiales bacterium]